MKEIFHIVFETKTDITAIYKYFVQEKNVECCDENGNNNFKSSLRDAMENIMFWLSQMDGNVLF